jgi:hypothetical protein
MNTRNSFKVWSKDRQNEYHDFKITDTFLIYKSSSLETHEQVEISTQIYTQVI